ncbi:MAG TPA: hypothetical protein VL588_00180 [Bdellovibrionota bacterium]|jgi:hypothetical protein|nr:hypothetical protein [Bdellovibrionota bacterium]
MAMVRPQHVKVLEVRPRVERVISFAQKGQMSRFEREVRALERARFALTRDETVALARAARLGGTMATGLRLLARVVRPRARARITPTPAEEAEYALLLGAAGGQEEAFAILGRHDPVRVPVVGYARALLECWRFNWAGALPFLEKLENYFPPRSMESLGVGGRLIASYLYGRGDTASAKRVLARMDREADPDHSGTFFDDTFNFRVQIALREGDLGTAGEAIREWHSHIESSGHRGARLYARQWEHILAFRRAPDPKAFDAGMAEVAREFRTGHLWFRGMATEFYRATLAQNPRLLNRLYHACPHPSVREGALKAFAPGTAPDAWYGYVPGNPWDGPGGERAGTPGGKWLELAGLRSSWSKRPLRATTHVHRLLSAIALDLYEPPTVVGLHARVYPGERYHVSASPAKVRQLLKRLRDWIKAQKLDLRVMEEGGRYWLESRALEIRVKQGGVEDVRLGSRLARITEAVGPGDFAVSAAARALGVTPRSALRVLTAGAEAGLAEQTGKGRGARWRMKK